MGKVLLISTCEEKLHELEFVKPVEDILKSVNTSFFVKHYLNLTKEDLANCSKIIICGTSLQDNEFVNNLNSFGWLKFFNKSVLGICAGMQIIGLVNGGKIKRKTEIGFFQEYFNKDFLGIQGKQEVYHLHNNFVDFEKLKDFSIFCKSASVVQAVKHKKKPFYGVLFHPEARQKKLIEEFIKNG